VLELGEILFQELARLVDDIRQQILHDLKIYFHLFEENLAVLSERVSIFLIYFDLLHDFDDKHNRNILKRNQRV
jgi:hypothetical protein